MVKNEKISAVQLIMIIVVNRFLFGFSFMPTITIAPANQDAWIADLLSGVFIIIFAIPLLIMATRFKEMSFDEYFEVILGKAIGKIVNFFYALYLIFICLLTGIFLADFLLSAVMPETPMLAILLFMIIPCMYASYKGLECFGRVSIIVGTFVLSFVVLYASLNVTNMDFKTFLPILKDSTLSNLAFGVFNNTTRFCDCFVFFMIIPYVKKTQKFSVSKILIIAVVIFTLFNTLLTFSTGAVLGTGFASTLRYPYFASIQQISLFNIVQRIEFFNIIGWILIFFFKFASTFLVAGMILSKIFKTKSYKPFILPMNILVAGVILFTSISTYAIFRKIINDYAYLAIFTANFVIPFLILIVYLFRRKSFKNMA